MIETNGRLQILNKVLSCLMIFSLAFNFSAGPAFSALPTGSTSQTMPEGYSNGSATTELQRQEALQALQQQSTPPPAETPVDDFVVSIDNLPIIPVKESALSSNASGKVITYYAGVNKTGNILYKEEFTDNTRTTLTKTTAYQYYAGAQKAVKVDAYSSGKISTSTITNYTADGTDQTFMLKTTYATSGTNVGKKTRIDKNFYFVNGNISNNQAETNVVLVYTEGEVLSTTTTTKYLFNASTGAYDNFGRKIVTASNGKEDVLYYVNDWVLGTNTSKQRIITTYNVSATVDKKIVETNYESGLTKSIITTNFYKQPATNNMLKDITNVSYAAGVITGKVLTQFFSTQPKRKEFTYSYSGTAYTMIDYKEVTVDAAGMDTLIKSYTNNTSTKKLKEILTNTYTNGNLTSVRMQTYNAAGTSVVYDDFLDYTNNLFISIDFIADGNGKEVSTSKISPFEFSSFVKYTPDGSKITMRTDYTYNPATGSLATQNIKTYDATGMNVTTEDVTDFVQKTRVITYGSSVTPTMKIEATYDESGNLSTLKETDYVMIGSLHLAASIIDYWTTSLTAKTQLDMTYDDFGLSVMVQDLKDYEHNIRTVTVINSDRTDISTYAGMTTDANTISNFKSLNIAGKELLSIDYLNGAPSKKIEMDYSSGELSMKKESNYIPVGNLNMESSIIDYRVPVGTVPLMRIDMTYDVMGALATKIKTTYDENGQVLTTENMLQPQNQVITTILPGVGKEVRTLDPTGQILLFIEMYDLGDVLTKKTNYIRVGTEDLPSSIVEYASDGSRITTDNTYNGNEMSAQLIIAYGVDGEMLVQKTENTYASGSLSQQVLTHFIAGKIITTTFLGANKATETETTLEEVMVLYKEFDAAGTTTLLRTYVEGVMTQEMIRGSDITTTNFVGGIKTNETKTTLAGVAISYKEFNASGAVVFQRLYTSGVMVQEIVTTALDIITTNFVNSVKTNETKTTLLGVMTSYKEFNASGAVTLQRSFNAGGFKIQDVATSGTTVTTTNYLGVADPNNFKTTETITVGGVTTTQRTFNTNGFMTQEVATSGTTITTINYPGVADPNNKKISETVVTGGLTVSYKEFDASGSPTLIRNFTAGVKTQEIVNGASEITTTIFNNNATSNYRTSETKATLAGVVNSYKEFNASGAVTSQLYYTINAFMSSVQVANGYTVSAATLTNSSPTGNTYAFTISKSAGSVATGELLTSTIYLFDSTPNDQSSIITIAYGVTQLNFQGITPKPDTQVLLMGLDTLDQALTGMDGYTAKGQFGVLTSMKVKTITNNNLDTTFDYNGDTYTRTGLLYNEASMGSVTIKRTGWIHFPNDIQTTTQMPVILNFHGGGSTGAEQMLKSGMNASSDTKGYMAVYLDAYYMDRLWGAVVTNAASAAIGMSDIEVVDRFIDNLKLSYPTIDASRMYLTGMSNGGQMAFKMAGSSRHTFAALAVVSSGLTATGQFVPDAPIPVMVIQGTQDYAIPYAGGVSPYTGTGLDYWAVETELMPHLNTQNGLSAGLTGSSYIPYSGFVSDPDVVSTIWGSGNQEVALIKLLDGGHTWPSGFFGNPTNPTSMSLSANDALWSFFSKDRSVVKTYFPNGQVATEKSYFTNGQLQWDRTFTLYGSVSRETLAKGYDYDGGPMGVQITATYNASGVQTGRTDTEYSFLTGVKKTETIFTYSSGIPTSASIKTYAANGTTVESTVTRSIPSNGIWNGKDLGLKLGSIVSGLPSPHSNAIALTSNGEVGDYFNFETAGTYTIKTSAAGSSASGVASRLAIVVDGITMLMSDVGGVNNGVNPNFSTIAYTDFTINLNLSAGIHHIAVSFLNDGAEFDAAGAMINDRNIIVKSLTVTGTKNPLFVSQAMWAHDGKIKEDAVIREAEQKIQAAQTTTNTIKITTGASSTPVANTTASVNAQFTFGSNLYMPAGTPDQQKEYLKQYATLFNSATLGFFWTAMSSDPSYYSTMDALIMFATSPSAFWDAFDPSRTYVKTTDAIYTKKLTLKGHALVWGDPSGGLPIGADGKTYVPTTAQQQAHITEIMNHMNAYTGKAYKDVIDMWEVVNEPSHFSNISQADFDAAYQQVRAADGTSSLIVNDYGVFLNDNQKLLDIITAARARGIPIDAVGIQAHDMPDIAFQMDKVKAILDKYAAAGINIYITEFNSFSSGNKVLNSPWRDTWTEDTQAKYVTDFYKVVYSHSAVKGISYWGAMDSANPVADNWVANAGLLTTSFTPKKAYTELNKLINTVGGTPGLLASRAPTLVYNSASKTWTFTGNLRDEDLIVTIGGVKMTVKFASGSTSQTIIVGGTSYTVALI